MKTTGVEHIDDALRSWARGVYTEEAAVELLIRSGWTRRAAFIDDVLAGQRDPGGQPWVDWEALGQILYGGRDSPILAASGGELRLLRLAHSLAAGELGAAVPGLDRDAMALVLAAMAHANGSHEHSGPVTQDPPSPGVDQSGGRRLWFARLPSLYPGPTAPPTERAGSRRQTNQTSPKQTSGRCRA
jgi:hypothetical protein